jgi:hypothetical protein
MFHASLRFAASWNERAKYVVRNVAISLLLEMLKLAKNLGSYIYIKR